MDARPATKRRDTETAIWRTIPSQGLEVLTARFVRQTFPLHFHETYVVCVDEQGAHSSWYRGANVTVPERTMTLVPPGEVHTGQRVPGGPWHYRALYPSAELMADMAREAGVQATDFALRSGLSVDDPALAEAFVSAHRICDESPDALAAESAVTEILVTLLRRHAGGRRLRPEPLPSARAVQILLAYLHDHLARHITLHDLARTTGLTQYAVLRAFRRTMGIPPHRYLTQLRVQRAAQLLRVGHPPVAAAQAVGFADQSHLNRHFRRLVGVTPGVFAGGRHAAPLCLMGE
jgi:AraC-like DNA-binding protein